MLADGTYKVPVISSSMLKNLQSVLPRRDIDLRLTIRARNIVGAFNELVEQGADKEAQGIGDESHCLLECG
jgi:hypothetical protein